MKSSPSQALKNPGKIYIYGNYIFLNEPDAGIHIIDNSQPTAPKNLAFIPIPGNVDLAVTGNTLYADSYSDLVTFDISNPLAVVAKKFSTIMHFLIATLITVTMVIRSNNPDSIKVIVGYTRHDTTVAYEPYRGPYIIDGKCVCQFCQCCTWKKRYWRIDGPVYPHE